MNTETAANVRYSLAALYNESAAQWKNDRAIRESKPATAEVKSALRAKLAQADSEALSGLVTLFRGYFNSKREAGEVIAGWECWSAMRSLDLAMNSAAYHNEKNV